MEDNHEPLLSKNLSGRLTKIRFPLFDGTLLRDWIFSCEQFFMVDNTAPEMKVRIASLHMSGKVL